MGPNPSFIIELDDAMNVTRRWVCTDGVLSDESQYDALIEQHLELIADALREAEIIDNSSTLKCLGRQRYNIDLLLAEVDRRTDDFRRFVIVEDKLLKNRDVRRAVLAQVLEYATRLESEVSFEELDEKLADEHAEWLADNRAEIERGLQHGDFLLLICGDRPHPKLVELVDRFAAQVDRDPLVQAELAIVALPIFSCDGRHLLVPQVIGQVASAQRELRVEVRIKDPTGGDVELESRPRVVEGERPTARRRRLRSSPDEFFQLFKDPTHADLCVALFDELARSNVLGIEIAHTDSGRPKVVLCGTAFGSVVALSIAGEKTDAPFLRDKLHQLQRDYRRALAGNDVARQGIADFRAAVLAIRRAGQSQVGRVSVPLAEAKAEVLAAALANLALALGHVDSNTR